MSISSAERFDISVHDSYNLCCYNHTLVVVQPILIVYNTANTSAQTLIENTDRKMMTGNYRAKMSWMSNSEPGSSHSEPFSHIHDGGAPHLFPVSKEGCIKHLAYGEV